jgi:L-ribulose-5-phosphate 3-epimerase
MTCSFNRLNIFLFHYLKGTTMNRRSFVKTLAVSSAAASFSPGQLLRAEGNRYSFNCFTKLLQWLDYKETAEVLKRAGYDGADLTVRPGGHVLPERVEEDLPRAVEAFQNAGLKVPMMVTNIVRPDQPFAEQTLRTAKALGVEVYRLGYMSYDENLGIEKSIESLRPQLKELAGLNRQIGITGAYQNHAGTRIGATVWDLFLLLKGISPELIGIQYDIKHATAEGGHSWLVGLKLVSEKINCFALKDFLWQKRDDGHWKDETVPLGEGMVDYDAFFKAVDQLGIVCPITMHIEYELPHDLEKGASHDVLKEKEIKIFKRDLDKTKEFMNRAGLI